MYRIYVSTPSVQNYRTVNSLSRKTLTLDFFWKEKQFKNLFGTASLSLRLETSCNHRSTDVNARWPALCARNVKFFWNASSYFPKLISTCSLSARLSCFLMQMQYQECMVQHSPGNEGRVALSRTCLLYVLHEAPAVLHEWTAQTPA